MLDQITGMRVFVRVAAVGSLAGAGRELGLSHTMVTKHVDAIEARIGAKLLHRSTRRLTLTEPGRTYLDACARILAEIAEAEEAAAAGQAEPRGSLRMNVPMSFGTRCIAPLIGEFLGLHPKLSVEFGLSDRVTDLVEGGWDLAVRIGLLADSALVSRQIAPCRMVVCASPAYLAAHGTPRVVDDLAHHNCLGYTLSERMGTGQWSFGHDAAVKVEVSGTFQANGGEALREAALAGLGLAYQPTFMVAGDLSAGTLVSLGLDHPTASPGHIHVVFRPDRRLPLKSRSMIDFLVERFGPEPPWDRPASERRG